MWPLPEFVVLDHLLKAPNTRDRCCLSFTHAAEYCRLYPSSVSERFLPCYQVKMQNPNLDSDGRSLTWKVSSSWWWLDHWVQCWVTHNSSLVPTAQQMLQIEAVMKIMSFNIAYVLFRSLLSQFVIVQRLLFSKHSGIKHGNIRVQLYHHLSHRSHSYRFLQMWSWRRQFSLITDLTKESK